MGPTGYPETSLTKHEPELRNVPEERRPELSRLTVRNMNIFLTVNLGRLVPSTLSKN